MVVPGPSSERCDPGHCMLIKVSPCKAGLLYIINIVLEFSYYKPLEFLLRSEIFHGILFENRVRIKINDYEKETL